MKMSRKRDVEMKRIQKRQNKCVEKKILESVSLTIKYEDPNECTYFYI